MKDKATLIMNGIESLHDEIDHKMSELEEILDDGKIDHKKILKHGSPSIRWVKTANGKEALSIGVLLGLRIAHDRLHQLHHEACDVMNDEQEIPIEDIPEDIREALLKALGGEKK